MAFDSEELRAAFAAASARSLPLIPMWLGITLYLTGFITQLILQYYKQDNPGATESKLEIMR